MTRIHGLVLVALVLVGGGWWGAWKLWHFTKICRPLPERCASCELSFDHDGGRQPGTFVGLEPGAIVVAGNATTESQLFVPKLQALFLGLDGMLVANGDDETTAVLRKEPSSVPGRKNFPHARTYRLKLTDIPGFDGWEPSFILDVAPTSPATERHLARQAVPIYFTSYDVDRLQCGEVVTKVTYLPEVDPTEQANAKPVTLDNADGISDLDLLAQAQRRGTILTVARYFVP